MFKFQGMWLPDGEKHFPEWMAKNGEIVNGRGTYQIKKYREALKWCKQRRAAIDVGAHVGFWSIAMMRDFKWVTAFEPVKQFHDCLYRNVAETEGEHTNAFYAYHCALGSADGWVNMAIDPADSGGTHVSCAVESGGVPVHLLDDHQFDFVDFIKIDCEGYELEVLKGAVGILQRHKPCVIVEQKPHKLKVNYGVTGAPAVTFLKDLGAKERRVMSGDYIMTWD
jgi:FkbM family methyltransferase